MTKVGEVDRLPHAEPGSEPLGERGLPRAQRAHQHHQVPGAQQVGQGGAEGPGVLRRGQHVLAPHPSTPATAVRSASRPARGAPFGPNRMAAEGW